MGLGHIWARRWNCPDVKCAEVAKFNEADAPVKDLSQCEPVREPQALGDAVSRGASEQLRLFL